LKSKTKSVWALFGQKRELFSRLLKKEGVEGSARPAIPRRDGPGPWPLSYAQERLWFIDQLLPGGTGYNIPEVKRIGGTLEVAALERAINEIVQLLLRNPGRRP